MDGSWFCDGVHAIGRLATRHASGRGDLFAARSQP